MKKTKLQSVRRLSLREMYKTAASKLKSFVLLVISHQLIPFLYVTHEGTPLYLVLCFTLLLILNAIHHAPSFILCYMISVISEPKFVGVLALTVSCCGASDSASHPAAALCVVTEQIRVRFPVFCVAHILYSDGRRCFHSCCTLLVCLKLTASFLSATMSAQMFLFLFFLLYSILFCFFFIFHFLF